MTAFSHCVTFDVRPDAEALTTSVQELVDAFLVGMEDVGRPGLEEVFADGKSRWFGLHAKRQWLGSGWFIAHVGHHESGVAEMSSIYLLETGAWVVTEWYDDAHIADCVAENSETILSGLHWLMELYNVPVLLP